MGREPQADEVNDRLEVAHEHPCTIHGGEQFFEVARLSAFALFALGDDAFVIGRRSINDAWCPPGFDTGERIRRKQAAVECLPAVVADLGQRLAVGGIEPLAAHGYTSLYGCCAFFS